MLTPVCVIQRFKLAEGFRMREQVLAFTAQNFLKRQLFVACLADKPVNGRIFRKRPVPLAYLFFILAVPDNCRAVGAVQNTQIRFRPGRGKLPQKRIGKRVECSALHAH